jgi:hypothetical protein
MARAKAPKYPQGQIGTEKRFAPSSRKQPRPTGIDPGSPGYGTMTSGNAKNPVGRAASVTGTTQSRNLPSGQKTLESKAKRQVG